MKFDIYQVSRVHRNLASQVKFYGYSTSYTQVEARQAFRNKKYEKVAVVEANDTAEMERIANGDPATNPKIIAEVGLRRVSIGDIIFNHQVGFYYIKSPTSWDRIKI